MIEFEAKDFANAMELALRSVERRNTIPILSMVKMVVPPTGTADAGIRTVELIGTNLDQEIRVTLPAVGDASIEEVVLAAPRALLQVAKQYTGKARFELAGDKLAFSVGDFSANLSMPALGDWPEFVVAGDPIFTATLGEQAIRAIRRASRAMSMEETRYYLNGVFLHNHDGADYAVATDGHRLSLNTLGQIDIEGAGLPGVIVPRGAINLLLTLADQSTKASLEFAAFPGAETGGRVQFKAWLGQCAVTLSTKTIDGKFPDYRRVIPDTAINLTVNSFKFRRAAQAVSAGMLDGSALRLAFDGLSALTIDTKWTDDPDCRPTIRVPIECEATEPFEVGVNPRYLMEALDALGGAEVALSFTSVADAHCSPFLLERTDDDTSRHVLMPMRV